MSGIAGVWNLDGRGVDLRVLARMNNAISHRGPDGHAEHVDGCFGVAHQRFWITPEEVGEIQPLAGQSGSPLLVMDGRIDNRDELVHELALSGGSSDAACVLAAYARWDDALAEHLNGEFAFAIVDIPRRKIVMVRDAIGIRPLYYVRTERLFAFASEIKSLLAHPAVSTEADDEGLADYLLASSRPLDHQDITCFAGISALPPAHVAIVEQPRITRLRYWDFDVRNPLHLSSFGEYAEAFRDHFSRAVKRRTRSAHPVAISVSGGLDSSSIYCTAKAEERAGTRVAPEIFGLSYLGEPGSDSDEAEFMDAIHCRYGGIERFPSAPLAGFVDGTYEQLVAAEAPLVDCMWGVTRELQRRARARGARVLLTGHWGDQILCSTAYLVDLITRFEWRRVRQHWAEYVRWSGRVEAHATKRRLPADIVRHWLPSPVIGVAKRIKTRLRGQHRERPWFADTFLRRALSRSHLPARLGNGFHSAHARATYLEARTKYHVHCMEWQNKIAAMHGLQASFPMLDRDLLAFLIAIPGEMQSHQGVPRAILREAMRPVLPDAIRTRSSKADFTRYINGGVARDVPAIANALHATSSGVSRGYFDPEQLVAAVGNLSSGLERQDCLDCWDLTDAYGLEMWLQVFLTRGQPAFPPLHTEKI